MKALKLLGKLLLFAAMGAGIYYAVHITGVMTEHRGPIKDLRVKVDEATEYKPQEAVELTDYTAWLTDVAIAPLNTQTDEIREGDEYFIYYTLHVTNNTEDVKIFQDIEIGSTMSVNFDYEDYPQPEEQAESVMKTAISPGSTASIQFRVKTDESIEELGYMLSYTLAEKNSQHKLLFK